MPLLAHDALTFEGTPHPGAGKAPLISGWQFACARRFDLSQLHNAVLLHTDRLGGLGIAGGFCGAFGVDVDIDDEALAHQVHGLAARVLGVGGLVRYGRRPRRMLVFRTEGGIALPSKSVAFGSGHKVELIGAGKQFVAFGVHPKTLAPYEWEGDRGPHNVAVAEIPAVDPSMVDEFFAQLGEILGAPTSATTTDRAGTAKVWTPAPIGSSGEVLDDLNARAYDARESWVFGLGLNYVRRSGSSFTAQATWRSGENQTSLKIGRRSVYDFGEGRGYTPIGLVRVALGVSFADALQWLDERVGDGSALGEWRRRLAVEHTDEVAAEDEERPFIFAAPKFKPRLAAPANKVRRDLAVAVHRAVATAEAFHATPKAVAPRLGVRGREGLGKSRALRDALAAMPPAAGFIDLVIVPTLKLAHEAAGLMGGAAVVVGRTGVDAAGVAVCDRRVLVAKVSGAGGSAAQLCRSTDRDGNPIVCPFYKTCLYREQAARLAPDVKTIFVPMPALVADLPILREILDKRGAKVRLVAVDESFASTLVESRSAYVADVAARRSVRGYENAEGGWTPSDQATGDLWRVTAAVAAVAASTAEAIAMRSPGYRTAEPISRSALVAAGLDIVNTEAGRRAASELVRQIEWRIAAAGDANTDALIADLKAARACKDVADAVAAALAKNHENLVGLTANVDSEGRSVISIANRLELSSIVQSAPILFLDAGLLPEPQMRAIFPGYIEIFDADTIDGPGVTRLHIAGAQASKRSLSGTSGTRGRIRSALRLLDVLTGSSSSVVSAPKVAVRRDVDSIVPAGWNALTFGSVRGIDVHNGAELVAAIGTSTPAPRDVEQLAAVLLDRPVEHIAHDQWFDADVHVLEALDGSTIDLRTPRHPDPGVDAVLRTVTSEQRQAAARGRPADIGPDQRQLIVTCGDGSFDGPLPDVVVGLQNLQLGRFEVGLDVGVLVESATVAGRLYGWTEEEVAAERRHPAEGLALIRVGAELAPKPSNRTLEGQGANSPGWFAVQIQTPGRGRTTSRAWVFAPSPADAATVIRDRLAAVGVQLMKAEPIALPDGSPLTLAAVGDALLRRQPTEGEVATWIADRAACYAMPAMEPYPVRTEPQPVVVDHVARRHDAGLDFDMARELAHERLVQHALAAAGISIEDAAELLVLKVEEPDVWQALPIEVREAAVLAAA